MRESMKDYIKQSNGNILCLVSHKRHYSDEDIRNIVDYIISDDLDINDLLIDSNPISLEAMKDLKRLKLKRLCLNENDLTKESLDELATFADLEVLNMY
jgi:hypothetical protein